MKTLYLCGASNPEGVRLARRVSERTRRWEELVLVDDDPRTHGKSVLGVRVIGPFEALAGAAHGEVEVVNMVARTAGKRALAETRIEGFGFPFTSLVHPDVDTLGVDLGSGVTVYEHAVLCPHSVVGAGSVVFMRAIVGHGSRVGRGCVIAPGAVMNARVVLDDGVYVGSNATLLPEVRVGAGATVGAGTVVLQDVPAGATVFGVPGQILSSCGLDAQAEVSTEQGDHRSERSGSDVDGRVEEALAAAWAAVLGIRSVDREVNFCDLGGNSLRALQLYARIKASFGPDVLLTDLYRFPTIRSLARHMTVSQRASRSGREHVDRAAIRREVHSRGLGNRS